MNQLQTHIFVQMQISALINAALKLCTYNYHWSSSSTYYFVLRCLREFKTCKSLQSRLLTSFRTPIPAVSALAGTFLVYPNVSSEKKLKKNYLCCVKESTH